MGHDCAHTRVYAQDAGRGYIYEAALFHVCCGDMWSEAYALPELPIASIHPSVSS